jgi:hypothetical protein
MTDLDIYLSFRELILQGKFQNKHGELEDTLRVLERAGWLTRGQRQYLQLLARNTASHDLPVLSR